MVLETLLAECSTYDFKEMLEEKRTKRWLKSVFNKAKALEGYKNGVIPKYNNLLLSLS